MFCFISEGSNLLYAPELPITDLANSCYAQMFSYCKYLIQGPSILTSKQVPRDAYRRMFEGCLNLMNGPEICATQINETCFEGMFYGCSLLNSIKIHYKGNFVGNSFEDWASGVSPTGTFYYNGTDTTRGASAIPENWTIQKF